MVRSGPEAMGQIVDLPDLREVRLGDRRVDLELQTRPLHRLDPRYRACEGARHAAEGVVTFRFRTVDADAHPPDPGPDQILRNRFGHQGPVRREDHPEPLPVPIGGDLIDVGTQRGLAAGQDDDRFADGRDLIQNLLAFFGIQFPLIRPAQGRCAAVAAGEVAAPRHLPGDHPEGMGQN